MINLHAEFYFAVVIVLLYINISLVFVLFIRKLRKMEKVDRKLILDRLLYRVVAGQALKRKNPKLLESYKDMKQSLILEQNALYRISGAIGSEKIQNKNCRRIRSRNKIVRMEAAVNLSILATDPCRLALEQAIIKEKDFPTKLYLANALSDIGDGQSLPVLVSTLTDAHRWYRDKVNMLICSFEEAFHDYLPELMGRQDYEIKELIVAFSEQYISMPLRDYIVDLIDGMENHLEHVEKNALSNTQKGCYSCIHGKIVTPDGSRLCRYKGVVDYDYRCRRHTLYPSSYSQGVNYRQLIYKAVSVLSQNYYEELNKDKYFKHADLRIRELAIENLGRFSDLKQFNQLIDYLCEESSADSAVTGILAAIERNPIFIRRLIRAYFENEDMPSRTWLVDCLSYKIEYLIMKTTVADRKQVATIVKHILLQGKTSQFIWFINNNKDEAIEAYLLKIVLEVCKESEETRESFSRYLKSELLDRIGIKPFVESGKNRQDKRDPEFVRMMWIMVIGLLSLFPLVYVLRHLDTLSIYDWQQHMRTYIVDFNYYLVFYSIAINFVYLVLLCLSLFGARTQRKLWHLKTPTMLFKKHMLPSVSVIAPAFNEEKTITESVNSLLNLKYPDYELVVVNDGSKDGTLDVLVKYFSLDRVENYYDERLKTKPVRGIYVNPSIPKLVVLDKENGGKADALNAGINISSREYFCGIDADSILEEDALLKLASLTLDAGVETPALGGNILPVNGCKVDHGQISEYRIPDRSIARLQTVEYVRSFMTGRLGWATIDSMLIISGAFGLFRKERIVAVGGYMTSSEKYEKDTVGEDMEMVVRTRRLMKEKNLKYKIGFAFDSNCWTQVPEDRSSLKRQRQRWSRGLADTLSFHKKLLFNPRYGRVGLLAMPYFFVFELAGPLVEIQGYIMVLLALLLGYLNIEMALTLFVTTICLGVFVSMSSFLILEHSNMKFKGRDLLKLLVYAIFENFGARQMATVWRATAVFRLLTRNEGWGEHKRQQFDKAEESAAKAG